MKELARNHIFQQVYDSCFNKVENYHKTVQVIVNNTELRNGPSSESEDDLFRDVDEIYPYIRRGGLPESIRVRSLHESSTCTQTKPYTRSSSQPVLVHRAEKTSSIISNHMLRQHTISSPTREVTLQFQSTSGSLNISQEWHPKTIHQETRHGFEGIFTFRIESGFWLHWRCILHTR